MEAPFLCVYSLNYCTHPNSAIVLFATLHLTSYTCKKTFCMKVGSIFYTIRAYFRICTPIMTFLSWYPFYSKGELMFAVVTCYGILHFLFMMYFHLLFNSHYAKIAKEMFCKRFKLVAFINIPTCILSILPCKFPQIILFLANIILLIHTWRKFRKNNSQKHTANA